MAVTVETSVVAGVNVTVGVMSEVVVDEDGDPIAVRAAGSVLWLGWLSNNVL